MDRSPERQAKSPVRRLRLRLNSARPGETHGEKKETPRLGEDKVGYGRPPKEHQFKRGHSGNPSGGRKAAKSEAAILREILSRKVTIRQGDKSQKIPLLEAILLKMAEEALRGDLKAAAFLLNRIAASTQSNETTTFELSPDETDVMKAYAERLLKEAKDRE
jgi:Family of unknown function (DUF5681)